MLFYLFVCLLFVNINSYIITGTLFNVSMMSIIAMIAVFLGFFYTAKPLGFSARKD